VIVRSMLIAPLSEDLSAVACSMLPSIPTSPGAVMMGVAYSMSFAMCITAASAPRYLACAGLIRDLRAMSLPPHGTVSRIEHAYLPVNTAASRLV
jgi:hypothetical protein